MFFFNNWIALFILISFFFPPILFHNISLSVTSTNLLLMVMHLFLFLPPAIFHHLLLYFVYIFTPTLHSIFSLCHLQAPTQVSLDISICFPLRSFPRGICSAVEVRRIACCTERMCIIVEWPFHGLFPRKKQCSNKQLIPTFTFSMSQNLLKI